MTKTLTEQWREGTLPQGNYYIVIRGITEKQIMIDYYIPELHHFEIKPTECILEVLEPVPSYDEIKRLQEQLAMATKALNGIRDVWANNPSQFSYISRIANRKAKTALKEMEGVK